MPWRGASVLQHPKRIKHSAIPQTTVGLQFKQQQGVNLALQHQS
jgi:hypothetical protein